MAKKAIKAIIVAMDKNRGIGYRGELPWKLKGDLPRFKKLTMGNVVILGRLSYESLPGPLTGRHVIVLSSDPGYCSNVHDPENGVYGVGSMAEANEIAESLKTEFIFYAGGVRVIEDALKFADRVYATLALGSFKCDTFLNNFTMLDDEWTMVDKIDVVFGDISTGLLALNQPSHLNATYERVRS